MKRIVVDTVALLGYVADRLGEEGLKWFKSAEEGNSLILIPSIVVGEFIYTITKGKDIFGKMISEEKIDLVFNVLEHSSSMEIIDLSLEGWKLIRPSKISELHDRMIVATCKQEQITQLITRDEEIKKSGEIEVIW